MKLDNWERYSLAVRHMWSRRKFSYQCGFINKQGYQCKNKVENVTFLWPDFRCPAHPEADAVFLVDLSPVDTKVA